MHFRNFLPSLIFACGLVPGILAATPLKWTGINIPGLDFQSDTSNMGSTLQGAEPTFPSTSDLDPWLAMKSNIFRIPVLWNYIQPEFNGALDSTILASLDKLILYATGKGAYAILDIHNYARYNGSIINQSGHQPFDADFNDLWKKLATHYAKNSRVMFGIMNEPWGLDVEVWGQTVQGAINTIRAAKATSQYILVPGTTWTGLAAWTSDSQPGLHNVTDPNNSIIFDVHQYFDLKGGTQSDCKDWSTTFQSNFTEFQQTMATLKAKALLTEFGGGANSGCADTLNSALSFMEQHPDQFVGWLAFGTGLADSAPIYLNTTSTSPGNYLVSNVLAPHMQKAILTTATATASGAESTSTKNAAPGLGDPTSLRVPVMVACLSLVSFTMGFLL